MKKVIFIGYLLFLVFSIISAENNFIVRGTVLTGDNTPLEFANVFFKDDLSGDVTDEKGQFEIITSASGKRELVVIFIGYEQVTKIIDITGQGVDNLVITMNEKIIEGDRITVTSSSFILSDEKGNTLNAMDVVSTAGAAADVFRAILTLPGVTNLDEGAGLYIRGGDVSELKVFLDNGLLKHPYKFESATGGYFGTFSPFLLAGTFFSSGGFSAKYGNALSGILVMESIGLPIKKSINMGLGLAATSLSVKIPLIEDRLGFCFSGNRSNTDMLFKLNGNKDKFSQYPIEDDLTFNIEYYSSKRIIKGLIFLSQDKIGVEANSPTYHAYYSGGQINRLYLLNIKQSFNKSLFMESVFSSNIFSDNKSLGCMDLHTNDHSYNTRLDLGYTVNNGLIINAGIENNISITKYKGTIPYDFNDLEGSGEILEFKDKTKSILAAGYIDTDTKLSSKLSSKTGVRFDFHNINEELILDPRFSICYQLSSAQNLKLSAGIYQQFPDALYLDPKNGNPDLAPLRAKHLILGWEYQEGSALYRMEGYYKCYDHLILNDQERQYKSDGFGYARGLDTFFKTDYGFISGWICYSFLQTKRKERLYNKLVPADYDITHQLKIVSKIELTTFWNINLTYQYKTGIPYHTGYGLWNSKRNPDYRKFDVSLSYVTSFFSGNMTVFYWAVGNVFGRNNIIRNSYSPDYTEHYAQETFQKRVIYFGVSFGF